MRKNTPNVMLYRVFDVTSQKKDLSTTTAYLVPACHLRLFWGNCQSVAVPVFICQQSEHQTKSFLF